MKKAAVAVVSRSALRPGQAHLYDLIVEKLDSGEKISIQEAEHIWRTKVCRKMVDGVPHRTLYGYWENGEWKPWAKDIPMTDDDITFAVLDWLTRNIGLLVIRGYLKVIPMIELEKPRNIPGDTKANNAVKPPIKDED